CVPGDEPTTLELTEKIRKSFTGPMIAVSSMIEYRDALLAAGCDYDSGKASVIEMVKNLLSL
ncbi:hypothetical protein KKF25_02365, partial [Patescibacteria group bacterium]|nr:hypothetical protein [Patescibacteria group bacterium]